MAIPDFKLERYFARYEFAVKHLLSSSDCQPFSVREVLALEPGAEDAFMALNLGYVDSKGTPALRRAIAGLYEATSEEHVLAFAGAQEAISLYMGALLKAGDHVVVHMPSYQSLSEIPRALGCEVTPWQARRENRWELDLDELSRLVTARTRLIVVNFPHNPTGALMGRADFERLVGFARQRGIRLFSDEVYRFSEYDASARLPAASDMYELGASLGVTSKTFGLAGLRIGWLATKDSAILARAAALKDYSTICNSGPSEFLAALALRHHEKLAARNLALIGKNLTHWRGVMARHGGELAWVEPKGGTMAFPWFLDGRDARPFSEAMASERAVMVLPGEVFDADPSHFRVGLGRADFATAAGLFEEHLRRPTAFS